MTLTGHSKIRAAVLILAATWTGAATPQARPLLDPTSLEQTLDTLDRVAELYKDNALRFACHETIVHYTGQGNRTIDVEYIYRYDPELQSFDDRRMPVRRRKARKRDKSKQAQRAAREVNMERYELPTYLRRAYSWAFIFERGRRSFHRFQLGQKSTVLERPALALHFAPVAPFHRGVNDWAGTAWIDLETAQLLRVEARLREDDERKRELRETLEAAARAGEKKRDSYLIQEVETKFAIVKNGMRFPSEVMFRGSRYEVWSRHGTTGYQDYPIFRVRQSYDDYRFFSVHSAAQIHSIVAGPADR